jgi:hypothetical protein
MLPSRPPTSTPRPVRVWSESRDGKSAVKHLLYRYRLTHTYCSLARLPPTHPFVCAPILQRHFQVQWRARLPPPPRPLPSHMHAGWFLQPKRRPARLPRRTVPSNCICRCSRMRARLSLPRVLLPHTCTQDGWFLQPTVPSNCICRCSRMRTSLPLHILLLHTQVSRRAHTYRGYASFSDICRAWFGFGLGLGLDSLSHSSSHALPFFLPPSFHTLAFSPAFTIVWWSA